MANYQRLGSHVLAAELAADLHGKIHRGLILVGSHFDRHRLVRTFSEEVLHAGLGSRLDEAVSHAAQLTGSRSFLPGFHVETDKPPFVTFDYIPGRNLAQMLHKARIEQIPLGVDHALSVIQGISQAIGTLHGKGLHHGVLSPSSIWVTFEGAAMVEDAPYASALASLLPKCPQLKGALEPYHSLDAATPLQRDLFAMGAILYELLTFETLPQPSLIVPTLAKATLKAAQEEGPVPAELLALLRRMLLVDTPFESFSGFQAELERALYDGDYSPTTFNMAFFMHTLFREESEQEAAAVKADQSADYSPLVEGDTQRDINVDTQKFVRLGLFIGIPIILLLGGLFWSNYSKNRANEELLSKITKLEEEKKKADEESSMLKNQQATLAHERMVLEQESKKAKSSEDKQKAEEKLAELARREQENQKRLQQVEQQKRTNEQNLQAIKSSTSLPPQMAAASVPQPGKPSQAQAQPQQAAAPQMPATGVPPTPMNIPQPSVPQPSASAAPAPTVGEVTPAEIVARAPLAASALNRARAMARATRAADSDLTIKLQVWVDENGQPRRVRTEQVSGTNLGLEEAANEAALKSTFKAAMRNGKPVPQWCSMSWVIKLK